MFKNHGYNVSERAYLLHYFVKDKNNPPIEVAFDSYVDLVKIDLDAFECKLKDMIALLNGAYPVYNPNCEKCTDYQGREGIGSGIVN